MAIIGAPVYVGRIPDVFIKRFNELDLAETVCIPVVVYGNREFEDALLELKDLIVQKGGTILGAGVFIGEHSLSTEDTPIAHDRPDKEDLKAARQFGRKLQESGTSRRRTIQIPGNHPYREVPPKPEVLIKTNKDKCTLCRTCIDVCPVAAIPQDNPLTTDKAKCLRCCACIKSCPENAREVTDPTSLKIRKYCLRNAGNGKILNCFYNFFLTPQRKESRKSIRD